MAGPTGFEPATSGVTGRHSNQLNYDPAKLSMIDASASARSRREREDIVSAVGCQYLFALFFDPAPESVFDRG